jgi:hypothetical protein
MPLHAYRIRRETGEVLESAHRLAHGHAATIADRAAGRTGGLQQQLSRAQLNAPYQQQLAQAAFPYQQAQFNAGITGARAPGLGGTSYGQGSTTSPAPLG